MLNLHTETLERLLDKFDNFDDELSDVGDLLEDFDVGDDNGNWTDEGITRAGLLAQRYELAKKKSAELSKEIQWLNEQYQAGRYSTTQYTEKLAELTSQQRDCAQEAEDIKDAIVDLNRARIDKEIESIDKEIEAFEKLTSAMLDALKAQKDLHDYEKSIAESTADIISLQKQLASLQNDDSAAAIAKKKKLQKELHDAKEDLAEKEYNHSIEMQEDSLQKSLEDFKESKEQLKKELEDYLLNIEQVVTDTFAAVKENAFTVGQTINEVARTHGFEISESLTTAWQAGSDAIAYYGEQLNAGSSQFIANLDNVTAETWELQNQANATSEDLANMFANRADNLVDELQRSWDSEENLDNMTRVLQESFVDTINTGAQFDVINNPVHSVENAVHSLDRAVEDLGNDFVDAANKAKDLKNAWDDATRQEEEYWNKVKEHGENFIDMSDFMHEGRDYDVPYTNTYYKTGNYRTIKYQGGYAKGLSKAEQDELAWTQELGDELIVSPTRNSILTPIKSGDSVIDAKGTANLFELSKIDPKQILNGVGATNASTPTIQQNKAFGVSISNLVNIEGSVNDAPEMIKIAAQEAQRKIVKTLRDLNDEMKY